MYHVIILGVHSHAHHKDQMVLPYEVCFCSVLLSSVLTSCYANARIPSY